MKKIEPKKMHMLKVIKEALENSIVIIQHVPDKGIYLTQNKLEIPKLIRELFFYNAIVFENVSKQFPIKDWVSMPK